MYILIFIHVFTHNPLFSKRTPLCKKYFSEGRMVVIYQLSIEASIEALVSRIDQIIGLFCKRALQKRRYSAKETYNLLSTVGLDRGIAAYGLTSVSRIDQIIGLFCKRALRNRRYSAKETYNLIYPTDRNHPIANYKSLRGFLEKNPYCQNLFAKEEWSSNIFCGATGLFWRKES